MKLLFMTACLLSACMLFAASAFCAAIPAKANHDEDMKFALAISGGVSLGSYEAGLNWAFVKHLKNMLPRTGISSAATPTQNIRRTPWLVSVAGASAGSINTLMTALTWCVDEDLLTKSTLTIGNSITSNVFRETWENMGIEKLLPTESDGYNADDLLFSRRSFDATMESMKQLMTAGVFRDDCDIPFAFTVTRINPEQLSIAGVDVVNSRFVIPMRLQSDPANTRHVIITADKDGTDDPFWGNRILLPGKTLIASKVSPTIFVVDNESVIDAMQASSAFPLAFGSKALTYCQPWNKQEPGEKTNQCPDQLYQQTDLFHDGGVFDNVPLGTTKALAEPRNEPDSDKKGHRVTYINLAPEKRRTSSPHMNQTQQQAPATGKKVHPEKQQPLWTELEFLTGAVETSENYELYNVLRSGDWNHRMSIYMLKIFRQLGRNRKMYGQCKTEEGSRQNFSCADYLQHLPQNFSKQDSDVTKTVCCLRQEEVRLEGAHRYRDGDQEAIRDEFGKWLQAVAKAMNEPKLATAIEASLKDNGGERNILLSSRFSPITGAYLAHFGAFLEKSFRSFDYYAGVYDAVNDIAAFRCAADDTESCLGKEAEDIYGKLGIRDDPMGRVVFSSLAKAEHGGKTPWAWASVPDDVAPATNIKQVMIVRDNLLLVDEQASEPTFTVFIKRLANTKYPDPKGTLKQIISNSDRDPLLWFYPITSRASIRLKELADDESDDKHKSLAKAISAGMLTVNSSIYDEKWFELSPATVPTSASTWWQAFPYEFSMDARNGGWFLSWEPRVNLFNPVALDFKLTPLIDDRIGEDHWRFWETTMFITAKRFPWFFSSVGIGPSYYQAWQNRYNPNRPIEHVGGAVYGSLLGDKLRLTIGYRSINDNYFPAKSDNLYITLGITDLPGIWYWMIR